MIIATGTIEIHIHASRSLKEKRSVLRSILKRTQNEFNISIAEIGDMDNWKKGKIGFAVVGNDVGFVNSKADKVLHFVEELYLAEVVSSKIEIMSLSEERHPFQASENDSEEI